MITKLNLNNLGLSRPMRWIMAIGLLLTSASFALGQSTILFAQSEIQSTPYSTLSTNQRNLVKVVSAQTVPWSVERIDPATVRANNQGEGVKIAILDTGIDADHPDLRVAGGVSFVPGLTGANDDNGHGTMLAGIIGAQDNNFGIVGVAPEAEIYAVKVIGQNGNGDTAAVVSGIKWCIANKMQIINMSFGDPNQLPDEVTNALQEAYHAGIVIIAGAGNSGQNGSADSICYPAKYDTVISVGSTDELDRKANFSSTGQRLDLMAPGVHIISCNNTGTYSASSGTSFSAAYVSGVAALLISAGVKDNQKIKEILENSAEDSGVPGWNPEYGYGIINADKALAIAAAAHS